MAYESVDKLKKYMQKKIDAIVTGEKVTFNINAYQLLDEIKEMERKAKILDEVIEVFKDSDLYTDDDVIEVIQEQLDSLERTNDER